MSDDELISVWWITDGKPGHRNQLQGLADRLEALVPINGKWFDLNEAEPDWSGITTGGPGLVVGAGHRTHWRLLRARWFHRRYSVVLMNPSLPIAWFNAAIVPSHDNPPCRQNVLETCGALNAMSPSTRVRDKNKGVILIGGTSKHFHWDGDRIRSQVTAIIESQSDVEWALTDSRRTPSEFSVAMSALRRPNLSYVPHTGTPPDWIRSHLTIADQCWVSPDSVSMVYEALTSGISTGLLDLRPERRTRVVADLDELIDTDRATPWERWRKGDRLRAPGEPLWESDRAARWLLDRYRKEQRR